MRTLLPFLILCVWFATPNSNAQSIQNILNLKKGDTLAIELTNYTSGDIKWQERTGIFSEWKNIDGQTGPQIIITTDTI